MIEGLWQSEIDHQKRLFVASNVADVDEGECRLALDLPIGTWNEFHQFWDHPRVDHALYLFVSPGRDVGKDPTCFLDNALLFVLQEHHEGWEDVAVEEDLCGHLIRRRDQADGTKSSTTHKGVFCTEEGHKSFADATIHDFHDQIGVSVHV